MSGFSEYLYEKTEYAMSRTKNNLLTERLVYNGESRTKTHVHLISYTPASFQETECDDFGKTLSETDPAGKLWVRVHGLEDTARIGAICARFGVDFLVVQDILNVNHPSKVEEYDKFNFVVSGIFTDDRIMRIRLVQGANFVLTFTEGESALYDGVAQALRDNVLKIRTRSADYLFSVMINELVSNYISVGMSIGDELDDLETSLIAAADSRDLGGLLQIQRRRYMDLKRVVIPLRDQYTKLLRSDSGLIHAANKPFFNDVNDHLLNVSQLIDGCRETLSSLMDLYIANNDMRMNDIMKRLTIVSTIFIPLTFLVGVWGMNFKFMPELEWEHGYLAAWGIMLVVGIAAYFVFKTKRWR